MNVALSSAWEALGGPPAAIDAISVGGPTGILASPLPCEDAAVACVASALLAARELGAVRGRAIERVTLDRGDVATTVRSEAYARVGGQPLGPGFAPLSRWFNTSDGWIRTHGNYPQHRAALQRALDLHGDDVERAAAAIAERTAREAEDAIVAAGGCAAALRSPEEWAAEPAGQALARSDLLDSVPTGGGERRLGPAGRLPATGVRVLDLTRVIAGPVGGRTLGALGADVLRIDAPGAIELDGSIIDTTVGKRSARLDLASDDGRARMDALLGEADVLLMGYRPGALERLGLDPARLAADHSHLVVAGLSAWGDSGPWGERRGFDSLVQAGAGVAATVTPTDADSPGALPCQLLDHGTGHLMAAAALLGLADRERGDGARHYRFALARTSAWLLGLPRREPHEAAVTEPRMTAFGDVAVAAPAGALDGEPLEWRSGPARYGTDAASF